MEYTNLLWYSNPAQNWDEALPVGNGRLGGMVFGAPLKETIQLNEDSVWSGGKRKRVNPQAREHLAEVRALLAEGRIAKAEELVWENFCGVPVNQRHYQPLGDLTILHTGLGEISACKRKYGGAVCERRCEQNAPEDYTKYRRYLDLYNAICVTEYSAGGFDFRREVLASAPDQVLVVRITAAQPGAVSIRLQIDGRDDDFDQNAPAGADCIYYCGSAGGACGIGFAAYIKVTAEGGSVFNQGRFVCAEGCDAVTLYVSCRTSYRHTEYRALAVLDCEKAAELGYEQVKARHIADYEGYYQRTVFSLADNSGGKSALSTDARLQNLRDGGTDNELFVLYWNYSRYLMISASREGTLPMNLQGIWNKDMWPAWGCRFTVNINTEMNYWGAETSNLSELHSPLFDHIERMRPDGRETAREMYDCGGFVCHHNTDIWGDTAPQDLWMPATQWPMGAAWLCLHIWEHYRFTLDNAFLDEKFETLKEASEFFVDFLTFDNQGRLITSPSVSPENTYINPQGEKGSLCAGPSMDSQMIYALFTAVIESALILGRDVDYAKKLITMREKLPKPHIGKMGGIMEWAEDYEEAEPGHRHISQLFALYPAELITMRGTPELAAAARKTIERRLSHGGGHTGWSRAWIVNLWARLFDGAKVQENLTALLAHSTNNNLLDSHPPFQIDGNFGGAAGMMESLLQSTGGELIFLPALPDAWHTGRFENLCARGGFVVSAAWEQGKLTRVEILSRCGRPCRLVSTQALRVASAGKPVETTTEHGALCFETEQGVTYTLLPAQEV